MGCWNAVLATNKVSRYINRTAKESGPKIHIQKCFPFLEHTVEHLKCTAAAPPASPHPTTGDIRVIHESVGTCHPSERYILHYGNRSSNVTLYNTESNACTSNHELDTAGTRNLMTNALGKSMYT